MLHVLFGACVYDRVGLLLVTVMILAVTPATAPDLVLKWCECGGITDNYSR